jgi:hypothetical protein
LLSYAPARPLLGSTTPRIWTPPLVTGRPGPCGCGCALTPETSLGFSAVDFGADIIGVSPLPWQRWLLIHALELLPCGRFRFRTLLVLVARQNGKTSIVEVKNLWKMFVLGVPLVIGTAQKLDYAEESWEKAVEIAESIPELASEIKHVDKTNGKKALKLQSGSRWKVAAASRRGGRSLSGDDVNLDELREHQTWEAWGAVTKTTMAKGNAQIWAYSNAGDDKSVVLNSLQKIGRAAAENPAGADLSMGHFEWSVPDDVRCDCGRPGEQHTLACRLQDRALWAMANPSLGYTVTEGAIASALGTDPVEIFLTEVLCQHVQDLTPRWQVIPEASWSALADAEVKPSDRVGPISISAETTQDRSFSAIGVAFRTADGLMHVEVDRYRPGATWVVPRLKELLAKYEGGICALVIDKVGSASSFVDDLEEDGFEVAQPTVGEVTEAYGQFFDGCVPAEGAESSVRHLDQPELNAAVAGALTRRIGDREAWDRKAGPHMPPLVAVTLAAWGWSDEGDPLDNIW